MARKSKPIAEYLKEMWDSGQELKGVQKRLGLSKESMIGWLTAQCQRDSNSIDIPDSMIADWGKFMADESKSFVEKYL